MPRRAVWMRVLEVSRDGSYLGFRINPKTLQEQGCRVENGVLIEQKHLIHHSAIEAVAPYYSDIRYGGLTPLTVPEQKVKYGID